MKDASKVNQCLTLYAQSFPSDTDSITLIDRYRDLGVGSSSTTIKLGVLYKNHTLKASRVLELLLADPLANNSRSWYYELVKRDRSKPTTIVHESSAIANSPGAIRVSLPVLSAKFRPHFLTQSLLPENDIEIYELADLGTQASRCHALISVTDELNSENQVSDPSIKNRIILTIIDNKDYSPHSTESTPPTFHPTLTRSITIKVNSVLAHDGTELYYTRGASSAQEMAAKWRESNCYELVKAVAWLLRTQVLKPWLLQRILNRLQSQTLQQLSQVTQHALVERRISSYGETAHHELQFSFVPKLTHFFHSKLSWIRLYLRNDNVEYDLKDFFSCAFMPQSIEGYNYQRGNLVKVDSMANPLLNLKNNLVTDRVAREVQPVVTKILAQAFVYYQLPLSLIGVASYTWFDFSANAALAISLLGWTLGFNHVSRKWTRFLRDWTAGLSEQVRICIDRDCIKNGLLADFKAVNAHTWESLKIRDSVILTIKDFLGD